MIVDRLTETNDYTIMGRLKQGDCFELANEPHGMAYIVVFPGNEVMITTTNKEGAPSDLLIVVVCLNSNYVKIFSANTKVLPIFLRVTEVEGDRERERMRTAMASDSKEAGDD